MSNPIPIAPSPRPFSASSIPSTSLYHAITLQSHPVTPSTGGTYHLPNPGLRVETVSEPLAFPLTETQVCQLIQPKDFQSNDSCKHTKGLRVNHNPSKYAVWQVLPNFLTFHNPAWNIAIKQLVQHVASELHLHPSNVSASLYCMMVYSSGTPTAFKPTTTNPASRVHNNLFGTLSLQLPSSFKGGEHTIIHEGKPTMYPRGGTDGSAMYNYYYTAFFHDVQHEVAPITQGFRIALLYNLHWSGLGYIPRSDISRVKFLADALLKHSQQFPLGLWTLVYALHNDYETETFQKHAISALKGTDLQEYNKLARAAMQAGLGEIKPLVCSLTTTHHRQLDKSGEIDNQSMNTSVRLDQIYGNTDKLFRSYLECFDWDVLQVSRRSSIPNCDKSGHVKEKPTPPKFALVLWSRQKEKELRYLCAAEIDSVIDPTSTNPLPSTIDHVPLYEESHGDNHKSSEAKRLFEIALRNNLLPDATLALNAALLEPNTRYIETMLCEAISAFGWERIAPTVEKYVCSENSSGKHTLGDRIRMLAELVSRDFIPSARACEALSFIVEEIHNSSAYPPFADDGIPRWGVSQVPLSEDVKRQSLVDTWSKLLGAVGAVFESCSEDADISSINKICQRLTEVVKQRDENDLSIIKEAIETSMDIDSADSFVPQLRKAIFKRLSEWLISRFTDEIDRLTSLTRKRRSSPSRLDWISLLRLTTKVVSRESENEMVMRKFSQFLELIPEAAFKSQHGALLTATIQLEEDIGTDSDVLVKIKKAALHAKLKREEEALRGMVQSLEKLTQKVPFQVKVSFPGEYGSGVPEIEEFMASDRMHIKVRLGSVAQADDVIRKILTKIPPGTQAGSGPDGKHGYLWLQKPFEKARRRRLKYERNVEELERIRRKHAAVLSRLSRFEKTAAFDGLKRPENGSDETIRHRAPSPPLLGSRMARSLKELALEEQSSPKRVKTMSNNA